MSYLALYRRYRPDGFDKVIGQDAVVRTLKNQITSGKIGHAYLFTGARGTGKTSCAKIFARAVNCVSPVNGSPCGICETCKSLSEPGNLDITEIDAASNNRVDEIREIRDKVQYPPVRGKYKVFIIDEAHMLTDSAFNALLKTLEEPPSHALFILATTEPQKMPATILSRCMRFDFKLIETEKIASLIGGIYDEIGKKYDEDALLKIAKAGGGSARDALSIADVCLSYSEGKLTYKEVCEVLGASDDGSLTSLCDCVLSKNSAGALEALDGIIKSGKNPSVLVKDLQARIRDLLIVKTCRDGKNLLAVPSAIYEELKDSAAKTDEFKLLRFAEILQGTEAPMKYSLNPRFILECALIKAAQEETDGDISALIYRVNKMEERLESAISLGFSGKEEKTEAAKINSSDLSHREKEGDYVNDADLKIERPQSAEIVGSEVEEVSADDGSGEKKEAARAKAPIREEFKGKVFGLLIRQLRREGKIMLWAALSEQRAVEEDGLLTVIPKDENSYVVLSKTDNASVLQGVLREICGYDLKIKKFEEKKDDFEESLEKLKRDFGDVDIIK